MKTTTITAVVLIAIGVLSVWKPSLPGPVPVPVIDAPSVSLQALVKPIIEILNDSRSHRQASILAAFYFEASEIIRRDGNNERIVKTGSHLRTFCERAATLRFQGVFSKVPGLAEAIHGGDGALPKILGLDPGPIDHEKSADALHAVAWACQEAG